MLDIKPYTPEQKMIFVERGLPLITYVPRGMGGGRVSYTFLLGITCKKGGERVQIACKFAYVIDGRPQRLLKYIGIQIESSIGCNYNIILG